MAPEPGQRWPETPAPRLPEAVGIPPAGPVLGGIALEELLGGRIRGFSERLLREHHRIYREYYAKFREVRAKLRTADRAEAHEVFSRYRALRLSEIVAWNGVRLHELYFQNLGGVGGPAVGRIARFLERDYGSFDNWLRDFTAVAKSTRMWAVTVWDYYDRRIHNQIYDSNETGPVVLTVPLLVCDMAEHAYLIDFGFDKDAYLRTFFANVDWDVVNGRLEEVLRGVER